MVKKVFLIFLSSFCVACASLTDRHEYVRIVPDSNETKIYQDGDLLGQGPSTLHIARSAHPEFTFRTGKRTETKKLTTKYRWGHSFGGNALFLSWMSGVGWLTDYLSGAAWDAKDILDKSKRFPPNKKSKLLVLPPEGGSEKQSRFLGRQVEAWLKNNHPELPVLGFEEHYYEVIGMGFDNESSKLTDDYDLYGELIYETGATHIVFSRYDSYTESLHLAVFSPYSEKVEKRFTIEKVSVKKQSTWEWITEEAFEVFPNTFAIGANQTRYTGCAYPSGDTTVDPRYCANQSTKSPLNFISSFSLLNILHYRKREPWRVYFRFVPTFTVSYNQLDFEKATPTLPDLQMDWIFTGIGYGPRLSFVLPVGELFAEVIPFYAFNYVRLHSDNYDKTKWFGQTGMSFQAGLNSWLSNHWNMRLFAGAESQQLLKDHDISNVDSGTQFEGSMVIIRTGISVGYYFHEEKSKIFGWLF